MKYQTLLLDFDYTLADPTRGFVQSANYAFAKAGLPPQPPALICQTFSCMLLKESYQAILGNSHPESLDLFIEYYLEKADEIMSACTCLLPDAPAFLQAAHAKGAKIAIVTNKYRYRIEETVAQYGVNHLLDTIIGREDVQEGKPAPEGILLALQKLGATAGSTLYIGDALTDAEAARNAGVDFAAVTTGFVTEKEFQCMAHVAIAPTLSVLWEWLQR